MDVDVLRIANAGVCFVTIALLKIKQLSAGLRVSAATTFQKCEATRRYFETLVYQYFFSKMHTRKAYENCF